MEVKPNRQDSLFGTAFICYNYSIIISSHSNLMNELPTDIRDSLAPAELEAVNSWWHSLTEQEQLGLLDCSDLEDADHKTIETQVGLDDLDNSAISDEMNPYYDFLVNHELRLVGFVDQTAERSSYRVMCGYIASLGSEYRHGKPGNVL